MKKETMLELLQELFPQTDFSKSNDYIEDEVLDSLSIAIIVDELERRYNIEIEADYILPDYFKNIDGLEKLVEDVKKASGNDK